MPRLSHFQVILVTGLMFRLLAAFFSKGFAFSDDHFEVIEVADKWLHGVPFVEKNEIYLFSLIYPGIHAALFWLCEAVGIFDPQTKMLVVRLFHALVSMLTIYYGMKLAKVMSSDWSVVGNRVEAKIDDQTIENQQFNTKTLKQLFNQPSLLTTHLVVGWLLAIFWVFPFMSVRSLREFFCVPFLMMGFYWVVKGLEFRTMFNLQKSENQPSNNSIIQQSTPLTVHYSLFTIFSAFLFAFAFDIRYQSIFFPLGVGLVLLLNKKTWVQAIIFGVSFGIGVGLTQFLFDWLYWGNPLASLLAYTDYNAKHVTEYLVGPWYIYIFTIGGVLLVPACFLFFTGYFYTWRKYLLVFLPSFLFIVFHSYFPGKQERFILPFFPFILLLGTLGFSEFYLQKQYWKWLPKLSKGLIIWFLALNTLLLIVLTFTYTKRSRVETIAYLYKKGDVSSFVMEGEGDVQFPPIFYLGKDIPFYEIKANKPTDELLKEINSGKKPKPNYLIITGNNNLKARELRLKAIFPNLKKEADIEPGFIDNIAYILNPEHNVNESWYVYKIE